MGDEVLQRVKEKSNSPETIKRKKFNWFGHKLRRKQEVLHKVKEDVLSCLVTIREVHSVAYTLRQNCFLGVRTEMTGRRGRRSKQMLDDLKRKKGYWKLKKKKTLNLTL